MGLRKMIYKKISDELNISDEQVEAICTSMHETTEEERHMNCRLYGFNRCEQMVAAIFLGMREKAWKKLSLEYAYM